MVTLLAITLPIVLGVTAPDPEVLWSGVSGGFAVRWTPGTLDARRDGKVTFRERKDFSGWAKDCAIGEWITIHSLVGPYLSTFHAESADCPGGGHPGCATPWKTRDLATGRLVAAEELWPKAVLLAALRADPYLKRLFEADPDALRTLDLVPLRETLLVKHGAILEPSAFWFHHLESGKVAVRFGVRPLAHAACGDTEELGLLLPIPPGLAQALAEAATGKSGFLRRNRPPRPTYRQWNGVTPPEERDGAAR
jgi:hypothetical protein